MCGYRRSVCVPPLFLSNLISRQQLIKDLHHATISGNDDQSQRGTQLLEIYALEIQMYNETRNFKKLKVGRNFSLISYLYEHAYRRSTTLQTTYVPQFHIHVSWVLSKNVAARCGWENVNIS